MQLHVAVILYCSLYLIALAVENNEEGNVTISLHALDEAFSSFTNKYNGVIKKTAFHEHKRLLFIAGLEGTGHHAWKSMIEVCIAHGLCVVEQQLTRIMMRFEPSTHVVHGLFGAADVYSNAAQVAALYQRMKEIVKKDETLSNLYILGLCFVKYSAMMSYPNYNGRHKALDHPDINIIAAIAETVGLDLRVLVLLRDAREILNSTFKRHIGGELEPKILISNAGALYTQLQSIDSEFMRCIDYKTLPIAAELQPSLLNFVHPQVASIWKDMLQTVRYGSNAPSASHTMIMNHSNGNIRAETLSYLNDQYHTLILQRRLDLIASTCSAL